jgi:Ca2+-binding EF-hand superfamily protein
MALALATSAIGAFSYLQSLLQQPSSSSGASGAASQDPLASLLQAFYPQGQSQPPAPDSQATTAGGPTLSPDTWGALIAAQSRLSGHGGGLEAHARAVFGEFDTNGDGQISKSEFENDFGANADLSKVDGLFGALDANGDGSISEGEMVAAARGSHAQHHRHHMHGAGGGQAQDGLSALLSAIGSDGATTQSASNSDGSSTTTITYADGSTVSMTTPASSGGDADSAAGSGGQTANINLLEKLIAWQSQLIAQPSAGTLTIA